MSDNDLEPNEYNDFDKSYRLVGQYLSAWARMESGIDEGIRIGLGLSALQSAIVCVNAGFTSKCHILQTLLTLGKKKKKGQRDETEKLFDKIRNLSVDRNMVAHTSFFPEKLKGGTFSVYFSVIQAKGNFKLPKVTWTEATFAGKVEELYKTADTIRATSKRLDNRGLSSALAALAALDPSPNLGLFQLGAGLRQTPPPLAGLLSDSLLSIPKTSPQTPQKAEK